MKFITHSPEEKDSRRDATSGITKDVHRYLSLKKGYTTTTCGGILALVWLSLAGGCTGHEGESDSVGEMAFRVRSDMAAGLNADDGWAGEMNESVAIVADQPFRVRFEVMAPTHIGEEDFRLQSRKNAGEWSDVEAHDFPHPLRELDLDFESTPEGKSPKDWRVAQGEGGTLAVARAGYTQVLRIQTQEEPLIGLYTPAWEVTELSLEFRLPADNQEGVGFVFGYTDSQNYCRLFINPAAGTLRVSRFNDGMESEVTEKKAAIPTGAWLSVEVDLEDETVEVNFEDDTLEFEAKLGLRAPSTQIGFYLPSNSSAEFREISIAGEASSPRISIVSCLGYESGAPTTDLLPGSKAPFQPGTGIALAERAPPWMGNGSHSEYEWALVVRRLADGAVTNEEGDTFELRMVTADGRPLNSSRNPELRLTIPPGHLGGTFVETPVRIGPWQASNGDLYFIMEPTETDNLFMMVKSTDNGMTWQEVDAVHRPKTNDLEAVDGRQVGDTLYILHQVTESAHLHAFNTSDHPTHPDTWAFTDELVAVADSMAQAATMAIRSNGSMVAFYVGQTLHYNIRSANGTWGEQVIIDPEAPAAAGPKAVLGDNDTVHVVYYKVDGTLWYRSLLSDGALTQSRQIATAAGNSRAEYGAVLPLVYIPESEIVVIIYRLDDGYLWERRIDSSGTLTEAVRVSDRRVVTDAVDSQQAGADVVVDGQTVYVLFIDEETRSICRTHDRGGWQSATPQVKDILGSWVRGTIYTRPDGVNVYGFIYDAGSDGGAGMNRFTSIELIER